MIFDRAWRANRKHRIGALRTPQIGEGGQVRSTGASAKTNPKRGALPGDDGYCNTYTDYLTQTCEVYNMLEATAPYGAEQTKSIYGYRVSFLAGEGIRVSADTPALQEWIEGWLRTQGMNGRMLTDVVGDSEVVGHVLWTMDDQGELTSWPSFIGYQREPAWWPVFQGLRLTGIDQRDAGGQYVPWLQADRDHFVFVRTGGHGNVARFPAPTTRLGVAIDSLKNYDRAVRQARELNSTAIRQSPTIELDEKSAGTDEQQVLEEMARSDWQMGDPVVTFGKYHVASSDTGPVETLSREVAMIVKDLSSVTGVPPHWLGYTDLLANRATANSLFEAIAASTHIERLSWEHGLDDMIRMARMLMSGPAGEFTVTMPLLSFQQFALRNDSLLGLLAAGVISHEDVRGQLPFDAEGGSDELPQQQPPPGQQQQRPRGGEGDQD